MMKASISLMDKIVEDCAGPLVESGYAKMRGFSFQRDTGENVLLVAFQQSKDKPLDGLRFTVNLGVMNKALAAEQELSLTKLSAFDCHLQTRLGNVMPCMNDRWWVLNNSTLIDVSTEVVGAITTWAVPYLDRYKTNADLVTLWSSGSSPGLTAKTRDDYLKSLIRLSSLAAR
jgi:Domain of unknown function (DUF4304)